MRIRWNSVRPLDGAAADATPRAAAATSSASGRLSTRVSGPGSGTGIAADCNHVTPPGLPENDASARSTSQRAEAEVSNCVEADVIPTVALAGESSRESRPGVAVDDGQAIGDQRRQRVG